MLLCLLFASFASYAQDRDDLAVLSVMPQSLPLEAGDVLIAWRPSVGEVEFEPVTHPLQLRRLQRFAMAGRELTIRVARGAGIMEVAFPASEWTIDLGFEIDASSIDLDALLAKFDDAQMQIDLLDSVATHYLDRWQPDEATQAWQRARDAADAGMADDITIATILQGLGDAALMRRDLDTAQHFLQRALAIRESAAPASLATAQTQQSLAFVALQRRNLPTMEAHLESASRITENAADHGVTHAETLRGVAVVHALKGDAAAAEAKALEALAIYRDREPGSVDHSRVLSMVGITVWQQGDLVAAEAYFREALGIVENLAPGSQPHAGYLNNLGLIHHRRFDFENARIVYEQATEIFESRAPDSLEVARGLTNVALAYGLGGEPDKALQQLERTLEIQQRLQPGSPDIAQTHHAIGLNHERLGDLEAAEDSFRAALRMRRSLLPASQAVASTAYNLGLVLHEIGNGADAEAHFDEALSLFRRLAPGTTQEAQVLHALGVVHRDRGDRAAALDYFRAAIVAIERQTTRLGGSEQARGDFSARFAHYYKDQIELLLGSGDTDLAFEFLERYRARMLREMLAERDLTLEAAIPQELLEQRRALGRQVESASGRLRRLSDTDANAAEIDGLLEDLANLQANRRALDLSLRQAVPRLAAIQPQAAGFAEVAASLDDDEMLLSFCVTETATYLFAARRGEDGQVLRSPMTREQLEDRLVALRLLMQVPDAGADAFDGFVQKSNELFELLLGSVVESLSPDDRLVILPDGPLHMLPFAALVAATGEAGPVFLVERHPLRTVLSATVYVADRDRNDSSGQQDEAQLAAFGDPDFGGGAAMSRTPPAAVRGASGLVPLPASRTEVESIVALFEDRGTAYLGVDATEEAFKAAAPQAGYLHVATHGILDPRFPLNSYLAFATPRGPDIASDNGLLHAWELFEQVSLDADMIVLSACQTALGRDGGGEGLLGLSWAFQYAGARSVVASMWPVADNSTAVLMKTMYSHVEAGMSRDRALRAAQLGLIRGVSDGMFDAIRRFFGEERPSPYAHPYHWAAFQLAGSTD